MRDIWTRNVYSVPRGTGSGFVWDDAGHVITNFHVIENASEALVKLADGREFKASLVGVSKAHDLAVLRIKVPKERPAPVPIGTSHDLRVGQKVYAIGNPFGLDWTLTTGIVSALDRSLGEENGASIEHLIQTDAAINPGNSGGPLLDSAGRLIGVNTAIYSPSGSSAGIGFAVPVDTVNRVVPQAELMGEVDALAAKLAAGPTRAFGGVKKLMSAAMTDSLVSQMERESRQIAELSRTPDGLEGVRAFVEKRRPDFMG